MSNQSGDKDEAVKLLPCPFCGTEADYRGDIQNFQIECTGCDTRSAAYTSVESAHWAWNRRHAVPESLTLSRATPRTDDVSRLCGGINSSSYRRMADLARQLEREVAILTAAANLSLKRTDG